MGEYRTSIHSVKILVSRLNVYSERDSWDELYNKAMPEEIPSPVLTFEAGLQQLEAIVKEMENGDLPLERAIELFESGMKLSESCRKQIEAAETRVEILMRRAGEMQPMPFQPDK